MTRAENLAPDPRALVGLWRLDRRLLDHRLGQNGWYHGQLELAAAGDRLDWYESGELHWGDRVMPASRRLALRPDAAGWVMTFADGRLFHPWLLDQDVVHPCAEDLYRGRISATTDRMVIDWLVTGPAKEQRIHTALRRT
jgi:hypothetical protein